MLSKISTEQLHQIELLILKEMDDNGNIMVRSLDKIHAKTGITYAAVSEIAGRLQQRLRI